MLYATWSFHVSKDSNSTASFSSFRELFRLLVIIPPLARHSG